MANLVTVVRIACSAALLPCRVFSPAFYALYIVAGLSDIADGAIARKTGTASGFGAKLDTAADFALFVACLIKLVPAIDVPAWLAVWMIAIAAIKAFNAIFGYAMRGELAVVHSGSNKATGMLLFLLPLTLAAVDLECSGAFVGAVATFAAIEEGCLIGTGATQRPPVRRSASPKRRAGESGHTARAGEARGSLGMRRSRSRTRRRGCQARNTAHAVAIETTHPVLRIQACPRFRPEQAGRFQ